MNTITWLEDISTKEIVGCGGHRRGGSDDDKSKIVAKIKQTQTLGDKNKYNKLKQYAKIDIDVDQ